MLTDIHTIGIYIWILISLNEIDLKNQFIYIISSFFFVEKIQLTATNFCHDTSFMTVSLCENLVVSSRFYAASHVQMSATWQPFDMSKNKTFSTRKQRKTSVQKNFLSSYSNFLFWFVFLSKHTKKNFISRNIFMDAWWYMFCLYFKFLGKSQNGRLMFYVDICTCRLSINCTFQDLIKSFDSVW